MNVLLIPLIIAVVLIIGAISFAVWAYSGRQTYQNNTNQIVAQAVAKADQQTTAQLAATYAQQAKNPLQTYDGPQAYGSVVVNYPKTWSAYIDDTGTGAALIDGYFHPGIIPALTNINSTFSLRIQVVNTPYSQSLQQYQSYEQAGQDAVSPYQLPKVPSVIGVKITGTLVNAKTGVIVLLPLRSETLELWTEGPTFVNDFNNIILPNFSFSP